jgi:hypothetical protein
MFAFPDMAHFFAYIFAGLSRRRFSRMRVLAGTLDCFLLRHNLFLQLFALTLQFHIGYVGEANGTRNCAFENPQEFGTARL